MHFTKIILFLLGLVLFSQTIAEAAPGPSFTSSSRCEDQQQSCSALSYVASKAMGALVKCASFACQWLPLPDFVKPARPTLRIGKPSNLCSRNADFSSFEDYD